MPAPDLKAHANALLHIAHDRMVKDFNAIPADRQNVSHSGCARTPVNVLTECAMINDMFAIYLTTGERKRRTSEEREAHMAPYDTPEKALTYLSEATERLHAAIDALDPDSLGNDSSDFFGRPMSRFAIAEFPGVHMMYHDGQFNYLHTLCGDEEIHW